MSVADAASSGLRSDDGISCKMECIGLLFWWRALIAQVSDARNV
jgi:hypothetical protein